MKVEECSTVAAAGEHPEPRTLTGPELEAALTRAARRPTIFDGGRLHELLAERRRRLERSTPS